jgi:hypothetical protein
MKNSAKVLKVRCIVDNETPAFDVPDHGTPLPTEVVRSESMATVSAKVPTDGKEGTRGVGEKIRISFCSKYINICICTYKTLKLCTKVPKPAPGWSGGGVPAGVGEESRLLQAK